MPLTPKGYCDRAFLLILFSSSAPLAEMPLTPKGYCDKINLNAFIFLLLAVGRNAPNAERLL